MCKGDASVGEMKHGAFSAAGAPLFRVLTAKQFFIVIEENEDSIGIQFERLGQTSVCKFRHWNIRTIIALRIIYSELAHYYDVPNALWAFRSGDHRCDGLM
jgi:hypothetical protein